MTENQSAVLIQHNGMATVNKMCASFTGIAGLAKRDGVRQVANKQLHYNVFHADSMKMDFVILQLL